MAKTTFKANGIRIKTPDTYKVELYSISDTTRTQDGKAKGKRIARKRKHYLTWAALDQRELDNILNAIWEAPFFFTFEYATAQGQKTITVYAGQITTPLHLKKGDSWIWKDVTVNLIEQ